MKKEIVSEHNAGIKSSNENYEIIGCPYCNSTNAIKFRSAADIVKCLNCETVYLRTRLKKESMQKLYQSYNTDAPQMFLPKNDSEIKNSVLRRDYWMKEIFLYTKTKGNCLDIGCGWGAFLDNARTYGFNPRGIEITKKGADFAKTKLKINSSSEQFLETHLEENSFSFVTLNHVLEHLPEPKEAIKKIYDILEPGGMFCGIVPNVNSLCSIFMKEGWEWLDADYHYVHYTPASLKQHLQKAGFIIEKIYTASGDYNRQQLSEVIDAYYRPQNKNLVPEITSMIEKDGSGEEIRFLVRKPFVTHDEDDLKQTRINSSLKRFNQYKASIIIPVYNKVEFTQKCLETLYSIDNGINNFEVIVVDNASSDDTEKFLQYASDIYNDLKVLRNTKNLRYAGACNAGAAVAEGEYLIFLNNDTVPTDKWLFEGLIPLITNPEVGIVGSKLLYADRTIQHAGVKFIGNMHPKYKLWPSHRFLGLAEDEPLANIAEYVDTVTGACLFIPKNLFDEVRGFNEEYQMYFEDSDLCLKVTTSGKKIFYQPKSVVIHYEGKSNNDESHRHSQNQKAAEIFYSNWSSLINKMSSERSGSVINIPNLKYNDLLILQRFESSKHLANIFLKTSRLVDAENILLQILKAAPKYPGVSEILNTIDELKNHKPVKKSVEHDLDNKLQQLKPSSNSCPEVSIIVPAYNNVSYTKEFVDSLYSTTKVQFELLIIDNASTDGTQDFLTEIKRSYANIKIISNQQNFGFPTSINQGILQADGKYILIANNDIVLTTGWLERLIEVGESDKRIGIVGPISNDVSGLQKDGNANYKSIDEMHKYGLLIKRTNKNEVLEFPRVAFLCTLIKKEVIDKIGGLDERFSPGNYEDDDFCLRAQLAGFKTIIAKDVFIHHYGSKSFKADGEEKYSERLKINKEIFTKKWGASPDDIWLSGKIFKHERSIYFPLNNDEFTQYFERSKIAIHEKEYESALYNLENAIRFYESSQLQKKEMTLTELNNLAGNISLLTKDSDSAKKYFEEELKLNPDSSSACYGLGEVYYSSEIYDAAKSMYEWAFVNDTMNSTVKMRLEEVNKLLGFHPAHNSLLIEIPE